MAQPLRLNPRAFAACASWLDAAEDDDEAATAPEAPRPTGPRAGPGAAPRARKTQQDASLAARIARDDRNGAAAVAAGRIRGDDSDDDAAGSASDDSDDEGESRYGRGRAAAAPHASSRKRRRKNE